MTPDTHERPVPADPPALAATVETWGPCLDCGRDQTRNPHPHAGEPGHEEAGYTWHCVPCLVENRHRWAVRARRAEANIGLATELLDSFDPTSGAARARVFVNDLRNCLEARNAT